MIFWLYLDISPGAPAVRTVKNGLKTAPGYGMMEGRRGEEDGYENMQETL